MYGRKEARYENDQKTVRAPFPGAVEPTTNRKGPERCGRRTIQRYEALAIEKGLVDFSSIQNLSEEEILCHLGIHSTDLFHSLRKSKESLPDFSHMYLELSRKHVTLALLWEDYIEDNPEGYQYSQYCELYRQWRKSLNVSMRQEHKAGEKVFVDYAGSTFPIVINRKTMATREAQFFCRNHGK